MIFRLQSLFTYHKGLKGFLNVVGESTDEWKGRKCKGGLDSKVKPSLHFENLDCFEKKHSLCWVASCGG